MRTGDACWFLDTHMRLELSYRDGKDGLSILMATLAKGSAPPVHVHRTEDEVFHILEGTIRFRVGEEDVVAEAGSTVLGPQGVPHGYRVLSDSARMLVITRGGFEQLVSSMARPAEGAGPPPNDPPTPEMQAQLARQCAALDIDLLGPPLA